MRDRKTHPTIESIGSTAPAEEILPIADLCRELLPTMEQYAFTVERWKHLYSENPTRSSWCKTLKNANYEVPLGHCGLLPLPLAVGTKTLTAGQISNVAIRPAARQMRVTVNGRSVFPIVGLFEACCVEAFDSGVELVVAYSSIPSVIWEAGDFTAISIPVVETFHADFNDLFRHCVKQQRKSRGLRAALAFGYAPLLAGTLVADRWLRRRRATHSPNPKQIILEKLERFDRSLDQLMIEFRAQNSDTLICNRNAEYFNWRFGSPRSKKYRFLCAGKTIGFCVIVDQSAHPEQGPSDIQDFLILREFNGSIPNILSQLGAGHGNGFRFTHFLSSAYSKTLCQYARVSGFAIVPGIGTILRSWKRSGEAHEKEAVFYLRRRPDRSELPVVDFSPLFYVPRMYET